MPMIGLGHNWKMTIGLIKMGHPTIFEKMMFWGKYGKKMITFNLQGQLGLNHSQNEWNKPRKTTF